MKVEIKGKRADRHGSIKWPCVTKKWKKKVKSLQRWYHKRINKDFTKLKAETDTAKKFEEITQDKKEIQISWLREGRQGKPASAFF